MSNQKDYGEIFCNAVDEIIASRLQDLSYDITKLCTIVDNSRKNEGRYVVSDGSTRFEAFAKENNYQNGNSVLVTIPNGDYNMQKTITGRVAAADTKPFNYTSPMDTMIKVTNNIFDEGDALRTEGQLLANENNTSSIIGPIYSIDCNNNKFAGFTRLGITADFQSWLNGLDVVQGLYGIKVLIYTDKVVKPALDGKSPVYELTFSSADMFGNPYQFESYFSQEKVFDISNISNINKIEIYFYQNGQFRDGNNNYIAWQYDIPNSEFGSQKLSNNLFVNNIKIYLGYEQNKFTGETLMLNTQDVLTYHYSKETNLKHINLRWVHKVSDDTYELLDGQSLDKNKYEVRWFKYSPGCHEIDEYAGENWQRVQADQFDPFLYILAPDCDNQTEEVKVVGLITEQLVDETTGELKTSVTDYYSNVLTFNNEEKVKDKTTYDATTALGIRFLDGSEGNYLIYDQNGKIINEGVGNAYQRTLEVMYKGGSIGKPEANQTFDYLEWWIPVGDEDSQGVGSTMILVDSNNNAASGELVTWKGVNYNKYRYLPDLSNEGRFQTTQFYYSIRNDWKSSRSNNTIRCVLGINGQELEALEEMRFGKAGTNGTNVTFLIEFLNNQNALVAQSGNELQVKARLYDMDGRRVDFTQDQTSLISWNWFKESDTKYMELLNTTGQTVKIQSNTSSIPEDNYFILMATYKPGNGSPNLVAYLPIPIKAAGYSHIEGAREVIYNHQGTITDAGYYSDAYRLYQYSNKEYKEISGLTWNIKVGEPKLSSYLPTLKAITKGTKTYQGFSASKLYIKDANDKVCVSCQYWSQPILIMQSQYDFAMLNSWNGDLTIDEENGTILSTMLGAGRKDEGNTFSGVLIGDIAGGSKLNDADTKTGVYGLHQGVVSYALKEDGTATFGKAGHGQIKINGNNGVIQSQNYEDNMSGMKIDLNKGIIDILSTNNNDASQITLRPSSPYFNIKSSHGESLINIGTDSYFIQSDNYTTNNANGTKLNLSDGSLEIKSQYGKTLLSNSGDTYFSISVPALANGTPGTAINNNSYQNTLLSIGKSDYYLQSIGYSGLTFNTVEIGGVKYNLYNNGLVAVDPKGENIKTRTSASSSSWTTVSFQAETKPVDIYEDGKVIGTKNVTITAAQKREAYLATLTPYYTTSDCSGVKIDLAHGTINGYDLMLRGTKKGDTTKTIVIDSSSSSTPLKISDGFSVNWDGTLTCNKLNSLNNDGLNNYIISICENFQVNSSGGASGSGVNFGGNFAGGFSGIGSGTFQGVGDFTTLKLNGHPFFLNTISRPNGVTISSSYAAVTPDDPGGGGSTAKVLTGYSSTTLYYSTRKINYLASPKATSTTSATFVSGISTRSGTHTVGTFITGLSSGRVSLTYGAAQNVVTWA